MPADNPYKIAIITGCLSGTGGGAPRSAAMQARALQSEGACVTLFTGFNRRFPLTPEQFDLRGCEIVASRLIGPTVLGLAVIALLSLRRRAREFDFIHLNGAWNLTTFIASRIARGYGVPYIITTRGHLGTYDFKHYPLIKFLLFHLLERRNIRDAERMHVCSEWELRDSSKALTNARVVKLPNPLDLASIVPPLSRRKAREELGIHQESLIVLFFGRVAFDKNPFFMLEVWETAGLPQNAKLVFVGPCGRKLKDRLVRKSQEKGITESVDWIDYVTGHQKRCWLAACDLFVLPSIDDSFSVSTIEAAISGATCLVSPFVGAVEYLPTGSVSVLPLNVAQWAEALRDYHSAPPRRQTLADEYLARFDLNVLGRRWIQLYERIISERAASPDRGQ